MLTDLFGGLLGVGMSGVLDQITTIKLNLTSLKGTHLEDALQTLGVLQRITRRVSSAGGAVYAIG